METTSKNSEPLIVERTYSAPVAKVWAALTELDQIKQWYFQLSDFKPEVGFAFEFSGGDETKTYLHKCIVQEVIPHKKLSYTWRYDDYPGDSLVSFELFEEKGGTLVRITHTGLETFPQDLPSFARTSFNGGWNHILEIGLKEYLDKA